MTQDSDNAHVDIESSDPDPRSECDDGIREDLSSGWVRPEEFPCAWVRVTGELREAQLDLFPKKRDPYLALANVSLDDLRRWRELRWISFDADDLDTVPEPLHYEIIFVRNLARSGLSDEWVTNLLHELEPPYRYHPVRTAYSFALGWVQIPPITEDGIDAFVREHLPGWIHYKALDGDLAPLTEIRDNLSWTLVRAHLREKAAATDLEEGE